MKREQLYLFQEYEWEEDYSGVEGDGLCEGEEVYAGELAECRWGGIATGGVKNSILRCPYSVGMGILASFGVLPVAAAHNRGVIGGLSCGTASPSVPWAKRSNKRRRRSWNPCPLRG